MSEQGSVHHFLIPRCAILLHRIQPNYIRPQKLSQFGTAAVEGMGKASRCLNGERAIVGGNLEMHYFQCKPSKCYVRTTQIFERSIKCFALLLLLTQLDCTQSLREDYRQRRNLSAQASKLRQLKQDPDPVNTYNVDLVCSATRYPASCLGAFLHDARSVNASPQRLVVLMIAISMEHSLSALVVGQALATLVPTINNVNLTAVSAQCTELLDLAAYHMQNSEAAFAAGLFQDILAWLSGALQQTNDCYYALTPFGSSTSSLTFITDMMDRLNTTVELISNSLALTGAMVSYGSDVTGWKPPPESRVDQLLELNETSNTDISPGWMEVADQAFLHAPSPQAVLDLGQLAVTVSQDSILTSIQAAVNGAPSWCPTRYIIYIKAGVYNEIVRIPKDKINLMFVGDGSNATIITGNLHVQTPGITTWLSATVAVTGAGFIARGITFENTAGPEQHQAVALRVESDKSAFQACAILGHQDSLYTHSLRQFFKDCIVAGTVDFIFGNSAAIFQTCNIVVRVGHTSRSSTHLLTAQGRIDPGQKTALVFQNCSVYGTPEYNTLQRAQPTLHRVYLGRPWKQFSRTVFIYTYMSEIVQPQGWSPWKGQFALDTLMDAEYCSYGPGAANVSQRIAWSTQLSLQQARQFSARRFLQADSWLLAAAITYSPLV